MPNSAPIQDASRLYRGSGLCLFAPTTTPTKLVSFGNVKMLSIRGSSGKIQATEEETGARRTVLRLSTEIKLELDITFDNIADDALGLLFGGNVSTVAGAVVTNESLPFDTGQGYSVLAHPNVTTFTSITGATGSPTFVEGEDYEVNLAQGLIKYVPDSDNAVVSRAPFKTDYTFGATRRVLQGSTFTNQRYRLVFNGLNSADGKPVRVEFYDVSLDLDRTFDLISQGTDVLSYPITAEALFIPSLNSYGLVETT